MDIYLLYAYVGTVCAVVIAIILNRVKSTEYKETVDTTFCKVLGFFIGFCAVDAAWGIIGSPAYFVSRIAYVISTYGFHLMAAWASFVCSGYVLHHLNLAHRVKKFFSVIRMIFISAQMILILQNIFTGLFFVIGEDNVYRSGILRPVSFLLQFCHYIPILVYVLIASFKKNGKETAYTYRTAFTFSLLPLVFGILQMLYPDGPFYSLGFLITSATVYAFNVTKQRESYLAVFYEAKESEKSRTKIEEALKKAEAANEAKTVFLANMSHDIRTPINGITGMVSLAKKEEMSPQLSNYLGKIDIASRHLLSLINDVLDVSRIESGKTDIVCTSTDVRVIADNCTSIVQGQMDDKDIRFVKKTGELKNSGVFADVLRVRQILINILGNAAKFTPEGGTVTFETEELSSDGETARYLFRVSDTGIGMSPEFKEHIFEAFSQENSGSRGNYQGTGLGMTITKQLTELMEGEISVESEPGKGSIFTVILPFKVDKESAEVSVKMADIKEKSGIKGLKILLAEDNEINMEIAKTVLEEEGADVTAVYNGKDAADTYLSSPDFYFDVILMDIMMPVMNGYDAARTIRNSDKKDALSVPIIAMTANAFAEDKIKAAEAGMNAHVAKPIDFSVLMGEINENLNKERR